MANDWFRDILIADLAMKNNVTDRNLIIVEDEADTKKTTVKEFKKNLNGDHADPDEYKFYSSAKIEQLQESTKIQLSTKAKQSEVDSLTKRVNDIITNNPSGTKDQELIDARDGSTTLKARLDKDKEDIENTYIKKYYNEVKGNPVMINDHIGDIDIFINAPTSKTGKLIIQSKNLLNMDLNTSTDFVSYNSTGFVYTQKVINDTKSFNVDINTGTLPSGKYRLYTTINTLGGFVKEDIKLSIITTDSTIIDMNYDIDTDIVFTAPKSFNKLVIKMSEANFIQNSSLIVTNIMVSNDLSLSKYITYKKSQMDVQGGKYMTDIKDDSYIYSCNINDSYLNIFYYDNNITMETITNNIKDLNNQLTDTIEKCGMLTDNGKYQFFSDAINQDVDAATLSYDNHDYMRHGVPSLKIDIDSNAETNPLFKQEVNIGVDLDVDTVSLLFYVDKLVSVNFTDEHGIEVKITSDDPTVTPANYFLYSINRTEMVQGWNCVKRSLDDFIIFGSPDSSNIRSAQIEIARNDNLNGACLYINSIIFNQKMKPTVLMCFDGIYENGLTYTYPLMKTYQIPVTILANSRSTLPIDTMNKIVDYRITCGWDIGSYGCNPNKEVLILDDNARDQYLGLKKNREWLQDNFVYNPISYSAPYGNLRPITVPILRDLGYKIARAEGDSYCSFFSEKDFIIPMHQISNEYTAEDVIEKIEYAIKTNQTICLYTNDVTEYGDEAGANKATFESIIEFIRDHVKAGELQCLTFKEFYNRCMEK